jgi:hypothetical protein
MAALVLGNLPAIGQEQILRKNQIFLVDVYRKIYQRLYAA